MADAQKFVPKFDSEGPDPVARSVAEFPDPAERALRVKARHYHDLACGAKSHADRMRDAADELDREANDELASARRCEAAAEEMAAPLLVAVPFISQHGLKERVRRFGSGRVMARMGASGEWMTDWLLSKTIVDAATAEAVSLACDALEKAGGGDE